MLFYFSPHNSPGISFSLTHDFKGTDANIPNSYCEVCNNNQLARRQFSRTTVIEGNVFTMRSCPKAASADGKLVLEHWMRTLSCVVPAPERLQSNKSGTHIHDCIFKIVHFMVFGFVFIVLFEVIVFFFFYLLLFTHLLILQQASFV